MHGQVVLNEPFDLTSGTSEEGTNRIVLVPELVERSPRSLGGTPIPLPKTEWKVGAIFVGNDPQTLRKLCWVRVQCSTIVLESSLILLLLCT